MAKKDIRSFLVILDTWKDGKANPTTYIRHDADFWDPDLEEDILFSYIDMDDYIMAKGRGFHMKVYDASCFLPGKVRKHQNIKKVFENLDVEMIGESDLLSFMFEERDEGWDDGEIILPGS